MSDFSPKNFDSKDFDSNSFDSKDFNSVNHLDRFSALSSNSSLDYANYLFLDDSLFFNSYKITADNYKTDDFPGVEIVDRNKVFSKPGYNTYPLPVLKFSYASLFLGICSFPLLFLTIVFLAFITLGSGGIPSSFSLLFMIDLCAASLGALLGFFALRRPYSRFYRGRKQAQVGILTGSISLIILFWCSIIIFV